MLAGIEAALTTSGADVGAMDTPVAETVPDAPTEEPAQEVAAEAKPSTEEAPAEDAPTEQEPAAEPAGDAAAEEEKPTAGEAA